MGSLLRRTIRSCDSVFRYGGEEFVILLPGTDKNHAVEFCNKLRKRIHSLRCQRRITVSGGIANYPDDTLEKDRTLFEMADNALYRSKEAGKDRFTAFEEKRIATRYVPEKIGLHKVRVNFHGQQQALDISPSGIKIRSDKATEIQNGNIKLELVFNNETIILDGVVSYAIEKNKNFVLYGVKFLDTPLLIRKRFERLLLKGKNKHA
jgi:hypothetical protein